MEERNQKSPKMLGMAAMMFISVDSMGLLLKKGPSCLKDMERGILKVEAFFSVIRSKIKMIRQPDAWT